MYPMYFPPGSFNPPPDKDPSLWWILGALAAGVLFMLAAWGIRALAQ